MDGDKKFRVYNKCKYDIGVNLTTGQQTIIKSGNFQILSINDIYYIEGMARIKKPFSSKALVIVGDDNKELTLEDIGGYSTPDVPPHLDDNEITAMLKKSAKQLETWLSDIEDPAELHAIYLVAKELDLPASKLAVLKKKIPNKEWIEEE